MEHLLKSEFQISNALFFLVCKCPKCHMEYNYVQEKCLLDTLKVLFVWFFFSFLFFKRMDSKSERTILKKKF